MHKRKLHHYWRWWQRFPPRLFLLATLVMAAVFIFAYRQNNLTALRLRDQVLEADRQDGDVESALRRLRQFTYQHMNAELTGGSGGAYPPIQLKYRYERLVAAEQRRASAGTDLYRQAQQYCEQTEPQSFYGAGRLPCIQNYLDSRGQPQNQPRPIPDYLYKFSFASPAWSPDLAGYSLLAAVAMGLLFLARLALAIWFKRALEH